MCQSRLVSTVDCEALFFLDDRIETMLEADSTADKINFTPGNSHKIDGLHERVAGRLKWVIDVNQGLYLKLGQALGRCSHSVFSVYGSQFVCRTTSCSST